MVEETWLSIPGYEGFYEVSDQGRVRGLDRIVSDGRGGTRRRKTRILTLTLANNGYHIVLLSRDGRHITPSVHTLVCTAFHGPRPDWAQCTRHLNGKHLDNRSSNLAWGTHKENHADQFLHGVRPLGEDVTSAKLTNDQVRQIRAAYVPRKVGYGHLAKQYGVSQSTIFNVVTGHCYGSVV